MDNKDRDESPLEVLEENIIIVGGGIGGLACALALHRVGLKSLVLEQAEALRARGGAITVWNNGFRVLDVLGVGDQLRDMFPKNPEWEFLNAQGKSLASVVIAECEGGPHELRTVERKCLLEALAGALPKGAIRFNSHVTSLKTLETSPNGATQIQLRDGTTYSAKVVIGYDGVNSTIGSWMGLAKLQMVGYCCTLGLAVFPNIDQFSSNVKFFLGKGMRFGYFPVNATKVYWFLSWNTWNEGSQTPEQLKSEAFQLSKAFSPPIIHDIITNTPVNNIWKNPVRHRLNRDHPNQSLVVGNVTIAGDACHPMTPHLGQKGSLAMEDAIVLARHLYGARGVLVGEEKEKKPMGQAVRKALEGYQAERRARTCALAEHAHRVGWVTQSAWAVVMWLRDWVVVPWGMRKETFMEHALFDVGGLPRDA